MTLNCSENLTSIGDYAFYESAIKAITFPKEKARISIGANVFKGSALSGELVIPSTVVAIDKNSFENCLSLQSVSFEGKTEMTTLSNMMFTGCANLITVVLPEGLISTGVQTFQDCTSLTSVTLPSTLIEISGSTFRNCTSFERIEIMPTILTIGGGVFQNWTSKQTIVFKEDRYTVFSRYGGDWTVGVAANVIFAD